MKDLTFSFVLSSSHDSAGTRREKGCFFFFQFTLQNTQFSFKGELTNSIRRKKKTKKKKETNKKRGTKKKKTTTVITRLKHHFFICSSSPVAILERGERAESFFNYS